MTSYYKDTDRWTKIRCFLFGHYLDFWVDESGDMHDVCSRCGLVWSKNQYHVFTMPIEHDGMIEDLGIFNGVEPALVFFFIVAVLVMQVNVLFAGIMAGLGILAHWIRQRRYRW